MVMRVGSVVLVAAFFAGCGADDGRGGEPDGEPEVETATQAAAPCPSVTETLDQHTAHGRAAKTVTPFLFWQVTAYYANRDAGSTLPQEYLGADGNQRVTLYAANDAATSWTTNSAICVNTPICGDGVLNVTPSFDEPCEGANLGGNTCKTLGFDGGGTLRCSPTCLFELDQCRSQCGNGHRDGYETCDGADLGVTDCATYKPWQYIGGKLKCDSNCDTYDESGCIKPTCGNGKIEVGEECDGTNVGATTSCAQYNQGFSGGTLKCTNQCRFDYSGCVSKCGDGILEPEEQCDGNLFSAPYASKLCQDQQYPWPVWPWNVKVNYGSGNLTCDGCAVHTDACKPAPGCYWVTSKFSGLVCF